MLKSTGAMMALALASFTPALVHAQPAETPAQARADQRLANDKANVKSDMAHHNKAALAGDKAQLRQAYAEDWNADHPPSQADVAREDRRLALAKEDVARADKSGNAAWKARADATLRAAYQADYRVHHWNQ